MSNSNEYKQLLNSGGDYRIWSYFKEHSVACISAFIAVITFFANIGVFLYDKAYFNYFLIDDAYISINRPNQLYQIIGHIVQQVCLTGALFFLSGAYETYIPAKRCMIYAKALFKNIRKEHKKMCRDKKDNEQVFDIHKINQAKEKICSAKKMIRKMYRDYFVLAYIAVLLGSTIISLFGRGLSWETFLLNALVSAIVTYLYYGMSVWMHRKKVNRKELIKNANEFTAEFSSELEEKISEVSKPKDWTKCLTDRSMKVYGVMFVVCLMCWLILIYFAGHNAATGKKEFQVVSFDEHMYVVIYNAGEVSILEECTIEGNLLTIHKEKQKIVQTGDLEYEVVKFKDVS